MDGKRRLFVMNPNLLSLSNLTYIVSSELLSLAELRASAAAKTDCWPSFSAVVEMAIDKGLSLMLGLVTYLDCIL